MAESRRSKITPEHLSEASRLKLLWDSASGRRTQAEFGEHYDLGNQANVGHYLNGRSPLNMKAAKAFATELGCDVADFSPRVAGELALLSGGDQSRAMAVQEPAASFRVGAAKPDELTIHVPVLANAGSMGEGADELHEDVLMGSIALSVEWIARRLRVPLIRQHELRFIHAYGDSMSDTFEDGDILLVNTGARDPSGADGVYVLEAKHRVFIKRVTEKFGGSFEVTSDNPKVKSVDILDGSSPIEVRGRVIWCWNGKKL